MTKLSELAESIRIDRFNLDEEMVQHSSLFWQVAERAAIARSRLDQAKAELDVQEAELYHKIRLESEENGEKTTENALSMALKRHPKRVAAREHYLQLQLEVEKLDQLRDSFRQRGFMLRDLAALHIAGYYAEAETGGRSSSARALEARAEYNSKRMSEKRRERRRLRVNGDE